MLAFISLCRRMEWHWTSGLPASISEALEFQVCATMIGLYGARGQTQGVCVVGKSSTSKTTSPAFQRCIISPFFCLINPFIYFSVLYLSTMNFIIFISPFPSYVFPSLSLKFIFYNYYRIYYRIYRKYIQYILLSLYIIWIQLGLPLWTWV